LPVLTISDHQLAAFDASRREHGFREIAGALVMLRNGDRGAGFDEILAWVNDVAPVIIDGGLHQPSLVLAVLHHLYGQIRDRAALEADDALVMLIANRCSSPPQKAVDLVSLSLLRRTGWA
jgi:hypothetical protein